MYPILHSIFEDKTGGAVFTCFGFWHFFYIFLIIGTITLSILMMRGKSQKKKENLLKVFIAIAFGLYMADFFIMPFAYGHIDVDKLPFHSCTAMCIICFFCTNNRFFRKYRLNLATIGFISALMYMAYPAGVMACEVSPVCYRAVQTLLFHSVMTIYGFLAIVFDMDKIDFKKCYRDLIILSSIAVWALIGNTLYSGEAGDYSHDFNWFFIKVDAFGGVLPAEISPYVLPFINVFCFFAMELIIYAVFVRVRKSKIKKLNVEGITDERQSEPVSLK